MSGCCARSQSTARRPISTPTYLSTTTSSSRGRTTCSTFPTPTWSWGGRRSRRKATRSRASMWWCGCAARRAERLFFHHCACVGRRCRPLMFSNLPDLLVRIDAPELLLHDPPVEARPGNAAPASGAAFDRGEHARLQPRDHRGAAVTLVIERHQLFL